MGILNRYILRQIAAPCALAIVAISVVGVANEIQERIGRLPIDQMSFGDMGRLAAFLLPTVVTYIVPITYLMGVMLAFGRMAQHSEIIAMKAAGVPLKRLIMPVIVAGVMLSGACFVIQDRVQPWGMHKLMQFVFSDLPMRATIDALPAGVMHDFNGWQVYFEKKDMRLARLENIVILKPEKDGRATTYYAASAQVFKDATQTTLEMNDVHFIPPGDSGYVTRLKCDTTRLAIPNPEVRQPPLTNREMTIAQLMDVQRRLDDEVKRTQAEPSKVKLRKLRWEIASERIALSLACLAVTLVAAPIGVRARGGGRSYTFAAGFAILLGYYVLRVVVEPKSLHDMASVMFRASIPNLALMALGVFLIWRVDRV